MLFVVETERSKSVEKWVTESHQRAITQQHFMGTRSLFCKPHQKDYLRIYVTLKPVASNLMIYAAIVVTIPALIFSWDPVSYAIPIGLALMKFFETEWFGFYALRLALWMKTDYRGFTRKVPTAQLIEEAFYDAKRSIR